MIREVKDNTLYFDGCSTVELAKKYGTPLYVFSETAIHREFEELNATFVSKYPNTRVAYASKAFCTVAMYRLCQANNACIDVVSGGELYTAMQAGYPAEKIEFNGNNKQPEEIAMALDYGIGRFIVDGLQELTLLEAMCAERGKTANVLFRITPGVKSDSHDYIVTGKKDSKFGIPLDDDVIYPQVKQAIDAAHINFMGFHFHVGSQLFDNGSHLQALDIMLNVVKTVKERFHYDVTELNLGGGFGAVYTTEDRKPYAYFLDPMMERIEAFFKEMGINRPNVVIEPGRSIAAEAGLSLYTVGNIKEIRDVRKYVAVDGGMGDNIRPALYQAVYDGVLANKADVPKDDVATICGKCCESGDILIRDLAMAPAESGDLLAIFSTGAYGYSMASNYNRNRIPAVVFVKEGNDRLVVKRQSYEDILRNEIF